MTRTGLACCDVAFGYLLLWRDVRLTNVDAALALHKRKVRLNTRFADDKGRHALTCGAEDEMQADPDSSRHAFDDHLASHLAIAAVAAVGICRL